MSSHSNKIKCCLKHFKGANNFDFIIYLPLSFAAALPGSLSGERGTCRCLKTSQSWVSWVSLRRWIPITLWRTTLSQCHQTFNSEGSPAQRHRETMLLLYTTIYWNIQRRHSLITEIKQRIVRARLYVMRGPVVYIPWWATAWAEHMKLTVY